MIRYYGIPGGGNAAPIVKFGDDEKRDPAQHLLRRDDLQDYLPHPFGWGHQKVGQKTVPAHVIGAAPLALALCASALADDQRALALYQRFKMRVMDKWQPDQPWSITAEEIAAVCDKIEEDAKATAKETAAADKERPPIESDTGGQSFGMGGVVWATDEAGKPIAPKEE